MLLVSRLGGAATPCAHSLNLAEMNSAWAYVLGQEVQANTTRGAATRGAATRIAILPFSPVLSYSEVPGYFPYLFPILLADYWPPNGPVRAADWRLVAQVMSRLGMRPGQAVSDAQAVQIGTELGVTAVIYGSFDLYQDRVKAYARYADVRARQIPPGVSVTIASALDASFLLELGKVVQGANRAFGHVSVDKARYEALTHAARRFEAVRDYIQGVLQTSVYDANSLSVANVWLKNAVAKDYRFHQVYRELARVSYMLATISKQRLIDPNADYKAADEWAAQAQKHGAAAQPLAWLARYREAKLNFALGMNALARKHYPAAITHFESVRAFMPEDGLNHYYLSLAYRAGGRAELSSAPLATALRVNPCFQYAGITF